MNNPGNIPTLKFLINAGVKHGMRVLDIGCGPGVLSRDIARLVGPEGSVLAIDNNAQSLEQARAVAPAPNDAPIVYEEVDLASDLPSWEPFDVIVGRRVLMYLPDAGETLGRLVPLLRPDGHMIFHEHSAAGMPVAAEPIPLHKQMHDWMWATIEAEGGKTSMGLDLPHLYRQAGLSIEKYQGDAIMLDPTDEKGVEDLVTFLAYRVVDAAIATLEEIGPDDLGERLTQERSNRNGAIIWDMGYLISGKKLG